MKSINKTNKIYFFICICLFVLILFINVFHMANKMGLHVDESLSFSDAQGVVVGDRNIEIPSGVYFGKTLKTLLLRDDKTSASVKSDVKKMILKGTNSGHNVVYFILLRLWSSNFSMFNAQSYIIAGVTLNFIFLFVTFVFISMLMAKLFENNFYRVVGLVVAFFNTATISNVIFIRFYCMQMMLFSIITYYFVCLMKEKLEGKNILTKKKVSIFLIMSVITLSGGYLGLIYILLLNLILFFDKANIKNIIKSKKFYAILFIVAISMLMLSNGIFNILFGESDTRVAILKNFLPQNYILNCCEIINSGSYDLLNYYFYVPTLIVLAYVIFRFIQFGGLKFDLKSNLKKTENLPLLLFLIAFCWIAIILWISGVKTARYYFAIYPILSVIFPYICLHAKKEAKKLGVIFILIYFLGAVFPKNYLDVPIAYSKVNYLFKEQTQLFSYLSQTDIPIYIDEDFLKRKNICLFKYFLPTYLIDDKKYNVNIAKENLPKHYYMLYLVHKNNDPYIFALEVLDRKAIKNIEF